ncbi:MAG: hypothetical protein EAZ85_09865 [Bacteroidetes bacterium]|nr:MAG: hypothetical protein EAZ85_09865 [Bacteroidota bacterium]TAG86648.1 MAG: hypothetical protein EAZ20_12350 [Bacteroidota bacterium]
MRKIQYATLLFVFCSAFAYKNVKKEKCDLNENTTKKTEITSQKEQIFEGTFDGIEQGDYAYFKVKNSKEEKSFMVLNVDKTYEKISAQPEKYMGKKVRVYWIATKVDVPEAGGQIDVNKYIKSIIL